MERVVRKSHLKCDETKPSCRRCAVMGYSCEYQQWHKKAKRPITCRTTQRTILPAAGDKIVTYGRVSGPFTTDFAASAESSPRDSPRGQVQIQSRYSGASEEQVHPHETIPSFLNIPKAPNPINFFSIDMPFKSKELFHYFYEADQALGVIGRKQHQDCLVSVMEHAHAFRNALLIASLHYTLNTGNAQHFQSTFLFHKLQTIRAVNGWLVDQSSDSVTSIIRQVASLCFVELCLGEISNAETHLNGIVSLLKYISRCVTDDSDPTQQELADRYFICTYTLVAGFKGRLGVLLRVNSQRNVYDLSQQEALDMTYTITHSEVSTGGLRIKLSAIRLLPSLLAPIPLGSTLKDINGLGTIISLRNMTEKVDEARKGYFTEAESLRAVFNAAWATGAASQVLANYVIPHIQSTSIHDTQAPPPNFPDKFTTTCCAMYIATNLYMHGVLGICDPGVIERSTSEHMMYLYRRDLSRTYERWKADPGHDGDFIFWQLMIGAVHICAYKPDSYVALFFTCSIRDWSRTVGIRQWLDARAALMRVTWPVMPEEGSPAQLVWDKVHDV
ncbi:hypothetical protein FOPG_19078 [Fusarium oxysporum f. sp. conglutinans race 2 54008]|uniref:Zn(2)-C6 fungal-type domain-containing protein n=1 Tax=Fusarium oxysporum f. sp. conglutinans race 2 54008 TaxID=1089457 RepID=X0GM08_FUSOX|nr:hypothetical protein FOPG_19078 [Fusarium oxysporum f. sp. conglutinans race 2 54008]